MTEERQLWNYHFILSRSGTVEKHCVGDRHANEDKSRYFRIWLRDDLVCEVRRPAIVSWSRRHLSTLEKLEFSADN